AFPLYWVGAEQTVHRMLTAVRPGSSVYPVVGHRACVAPVILMLVRCAFRFSAVLMAAVILVFFSSPSLFRAHHAAVLVGLLVLTVLALFEFFQDVLRFAGSWAEIAKRKRTHGEDATQKAMRKH